MPLGRRVRKGLGLVDHRVPNLTDDLEEVRHERVVLVAAHGTYKLTSPDVGHTIRSRVTATNADGSAQELSATSGVRRQRRSRS
jgi:hypothetical protein